MDNPKTIIENPVIKTENGYVNPDRSGYLASGVEWLLKMGFLDSPDVQMAITANVYAVTEQIEEVSLVADTERQKLLAYLKLRKLGTFKKILLILKDLIGKDNEYLNSEDIQSLVIERLRQALPEYEIRVIFDEKIYRKSKALSEKISKLRMEKPIKKASEPAPKA